MALLPSPTLLPSSDLLPDLTLEDRGPVGTLYAETILGSQTKLDEFGILVVYVVNLRGARTGGIVRFSAQSGEVVAYALGGIVVSTTRQGDVRESVAIGGSVRAFSNSGVIRNG